MHNIYLVIFFVFTLKFEIENSSQDLKYVWISVFKTLFFFFVVFTRYEISSLLISLEFLSPNNSCLIIIIGQITEHEKMKWKLKWVYLCALAVLIWKSLRDQFFSFRFDFLDSDTAWSNPIYSFILFIFAHPVDRYQLIDLFLFYFIFIEY